MTNGYLIIVRDLETGGVSVETTDDWMEYMDERPRRLIYCQAVSEVDAVEEQVEAFLQCRNEEGADGREACMGMNEQIADLVGSVQWIANENPLRSFRHVSRG